jgi:hypothetical protein
MFIGALFTIAKLCKQLRCPTPDKWIKKMWCLYTMEFCSVMKTKEILSFASKCVELENIVLSEVSQAQKTKDHMFFLPHMWTLDLKQCNTIIGHGSPAKGRIHKGEIGKGKKRKT